MDRGFIISDGSGVGVGNAIKYLSDSTRATAKTSANLQAGGLLCVVLLTHKSSNQIDGCTSHAESTSEETIGLAHRNVKIETDETLPF